MLVTEGSQQGLDLVARVLARSRRRRARRAARPTSAPPRRSAPRRRGWWACASDEEGLDLDDLRRRHRAEMRRRAGASKFLYVIPSFQNPSGISHSLPPPPRPARGRARAGPARRRGRSVRRPLLRGRAAADAALDGPRGRVVYLSSFSKILAPGLRTAFLLGPEELLAKVEIAKQSANLCGSGLDQRIILACLKRRPHRGAEGAHPSVLPGQARRDAGRARRRRCRTACAGRGPRGGLFVWLTLPEGDGRGGAARGRGGGRRRLRGRGRRSSSTAAARTPCASPSRRRTRRPSPKASSAWAGWCGRGSGARPRRIAATRLAATRMPVPSRDGT